jgi:glycine/D-amino acid oxidase-like deaminating enzyme
MGATDLDARVTEDSSMTPLPPWVDLLRERLAAWYPALAGARTESARVCVRPMPADGFSIVGSLPGVAGLYVAVTHSGITLGPLLGECVARELLSGERLPVLEPYRPERFAAQGG